MCESQCNKNDLENVGGRVNKWLLCVLIPVIYRIKGKQNKTLW